MTKRQIEENIYGKIFGYSVYSMMNGGIEIVARIAFVFILTAIHFIGMWRIFITTGLTWLVTALFALWRYKKGARMKKSLVGDEIG